MTIFDPAACTTEFLATKALPTLQEHEYEAWSGYLYSAPLSARMNVAEVLYRHAGERPHALGLFLACVVPSAERVSRRLRNAFAASGSDLIEEQMYDGAIKFVIRFFEHRNLPEHILVRSAIYQHLWTGAFQGAFHGKTRRMQNYFRSFGKSEPAGRVNRFEEQLIARDLLARIAALVPDKAVAPLYIFSFLRRFMEMEPEHAVLRHLEFDNEAIAKHCGRSKSTVTHYLTEIRRIVNRKFNPDGTFFIRKR